MCCQGLPTCTQTLQILLILPRREISSEGCIMWLVHIILNRILDYQPDMDSLCTFRQLEVFILAYLLIR